MDRTEAMVVTYELWDLETGNLLETFVSEAQALHAVSEYAHLEGTTYLDVLALRPIWVEAGERTWLPKIDGERLKAKLTKRPASVTMHVTRGEYKYLTSGVSQERYISYIREMARALSAGQRPTPSRRPNPREEIEAARLLLAG